MLKKTILWISAIMIALVSGLSALGAITKDKAPDIAFTLLPLNGFASENLASSSVLAAIAENRGQIVNDVDPDTVKLAKKAFITEPATPDAIAVLALDSVERIKGLLMNKAFALSRRQPLVNGWMIADSGARDDIPALLKYYAISLRVSKSLRSAIIPIMAKALADERFIKPFGDLLSEDPPWANQFWLTVSQERNSLLNAAQLRIIQKRTFPAVDEANDRLLVANLVKFGYYEQAYNLYRALAGRTDDREAIRSDSLARVQKFAPLDWDVIARGNYAASVNPQTSSIDITAVGGSSGVLARRLVKLTESPISLSLKIHQLGTGGDKLPLRINISCVDSQDQKFDLAIRLKEGPNHFKIPLENSPCIYYWFQLSGRFPEGSNEYHLAISDISLGAR